MYSFKQFYMHRTFLVVAALSGALSVILGASNAHALKHVLTPDASEIFETGVKFQFYHTFALLATGILYERFKNKWIKWSGACFMTGIILFSGSLYALAFLKSSGDVGLRNIGIVTPIGGLFFILGWLLMLAAFVRKDTMSQSQD